MNVGLKLKSQLLKGHAPLAPALVGEAVAGVAVVVYLPHALKHGLVMTGLIVSQMALQGEHVMMLIIVAPQLINQRSWKFAFMKGIVMTGL